MALAQMESTSTTNRTGVKAPSDEGMPPTSACRTRRRRVMRGGSALALVFVSLASLVGVARGAQGTQPSDRGCLIAWNAPSNRANRGRLVTAQPEHGLSLRGGRSSTDRWTKGAGVTQTSTAACLLTLSTPHSAQMVIGIWKSGRVTRWSWGPVTPPTAVFSPNVRLLSDGRLTKTYRRLAANVSRAEEARCGAVAPADIRSHPTGSPSRAVTKVMASLRR